MKRCLIGSETGMRVKSAIVFFADMNLPGYPVSGRPLPEGTAFFLYRLTDQAPA